MVESAVDALIHHFITFIYSLLLIFPSWTSLSHVIWHSMKKKKKQTCWVKRRVKKGMRYLASSLRKPFRWGLTKFTSYSSSVNSDRCSESTVSPCHIKTLPWLVFVFFPWQINISSTNSTFFWQIQLYSNNCNNCLRYRSATTIIIIIIKKK